MIPVLGGWTALPSVDGMVLVSPDGGRITYRERVRPILRLEAMIADELARHPGPLSGLSAGAPEPFVTAEGEHAIAVWIAGRGVRHDMAFVVGDDFYSVVHAAGDGRHAGLVRELACADRQWLGLRRRRYVYTPPAGWQGLARGLETTWLAPGYPRDRTSITVLPATADRVEPAALVSDRLAIDAAAGFEARDVRPLGAVPAAAGLESHAFAVAGRMGDAAFVREIVVLRDATYTYATILDSAAALEERMEGRQRHRALVRSVEPLPARRAAVQGAAAALWAE